MVRRRSDRRLRSAMKKWRRESSAIGVWHEQQEQWLYRRSLNREEFEALANRYKIRDFALVDNIIDMAHLKTVLAVLVDRSEHYNLFYETKANLRRDQVRLLSQINKCFHLILLHLC